MAAMHLLDGLGQTVRTPFVALVDREGRIGPVDAPWVIELGSGSAQRDMRSATVRFEAHADHVRLIVAEDLLVWIGDHLTLFHDGDRDALGRPIGGDYALWKKPWIDLVISSLLHDIRVAAGDLGFDWVELVPWPQHRPYAVTLSHDVDSLYEREPFALVHNAIGIAKPERDMLTSRHAAAKRFTRSLLKPLEPLHGIRHLLRIERETGIRATYFVLLDTRWSRYGARYRLTDQPVREMVRLLLENGHEVGLHTGVSYFRNGQELRRRASTLRNAGTTVESIRGHYLCFDHATSVADASAAGFRNDATHGLSASNGFRAGTSRPFAMNTPSGLAATIAHDEVSRDTVIEVPLSIMDVALFREQEEPVVAGVRLLDEVRSVAGLLSILWHNTYAGVSEYLHVEQTMLELLDRASRDGAWIANTAHVRRWFDQRGSVQLVRFSDGVRAMTTGTDEVVLCITGRSGSTCIALTPGAPSEVRLDFGVGKNDA